MKTMWTAVSLVIGTLAPAAFAGQMGYAVLHRDIALSSNPGYVSQIASVGASDREIGLGMEEHILTLTLVDGEQIEVEYVYPSTVQENLIKLNAGSSIDVSGCRAYQKVIAKRSRRSGLTGKTCEYQTSTTAFDCRGRLGRITSAQTRGDLVDTATLKGFKEVRLSEELNMSGGAFGQLTQETLTTTTCEMDTTKDHY